MTKTKKMYMVLYRIKENGPWDNVGAAFQNRDGSWNLVVQQPLNTTERLQLRTPKAKQTPTA